MKKISKLFGILGVASVFALTSCNLTIINSGGKDNTKTGDAPQTTDVTADDDKYIVDSNTYNSSIDYINADDVTVHSYSYNDEKKPENLYNEVKLEKDGNNIKATTSTKIGLNTQESTFYYVIIDDNNVKQFTLGENNSYVESMLGVDYDKLISTSYLNDLYASLTFDSKTNTYKVEDYEVVISAGDTTINQKMDLELKFENKKLVSIDATMELEGYVSVQSIEIAYGNSAFVLPAEIEVALQK